MSEIVYPFCEDAEESLIGSILIDPSVLPDVQEIIKEPGDFHIEVNRAVYAAMCKLAAQGLDLDVVTICAMLPAEIVAQTVSTDGYEMRLAKYQIGVPTAMHALSYARIVRGLKVRRLAIRTLEKCLPHLLDWQNGKSVGETLDLLIDYLSGLRNGSNGNR